MYAIIESKGIINLNLYPRIDVVEHNDNYRLVAFCKHQVDNEISQNNYSEAHSIMIAEFKKEVDAEYCFWHLLKSINNDTKIWNPEVVYLPSNAWRTAIERFCKGKHSIVAARLLDETDLKYGGSHIITIVHNRIENIYWAEIQPHIKDINNSFKEALEVKIRVEWKRNY